MLATDLLNHQTSQNFYQPQTWARSWAQRKVPLIYYMNFWFHLRTGVFLGVLTVFGHNWRLLSWELHWQKWTKSLQSPSARCSKFAQLRFQVQNRHNLLWPLSWSWSNKQSRKVQILHSRCFLPESNWQAQNLLQVSRQIWKNKLKRG